MTLYAVGDLQGCYGTLCGLLERIGFDTAEDRLWLVGDLVNRGPASLQVLRWAKEHADRVTCVLGNHDLHLLARAIGVTGPRRGDTLDEVLGAPDRDELVQWLRHRPLLHREGSFVLVHAGLPPFWSLAVAQAAAQQAEQLLRSDSWIDLVVALRNPPRRGWGRTWRPGLDTLEHAALTINALTRIRMCTVDGQMDLSYKGHPSQGPQGTRPWYEVGHRPADTMVLFGHWAALGSHGAPGVMCVDSGCVWGRCLTAARLPDLTRFEQPMSD